MVIEKKRLFEKTRTQPKDPENFVEKRKKIFLDYLMEIALDEDHQFTEQQLMDEVNTFIIAVSEPIICGR